MLRILGEKLALLAFPSDYPRELTHSAEAVTAGSQSFEATYVALSSENCREAFALVV